MCQEERVPRSWQAAISDFASESARRCMTWIPWARFRNRIHPSSIEVPNSNYMIIDSRKRLHIIHLQPDSTHPSVLVGFKSIPRQTDATDGGSPDTLSLEEYWFTKTNRPLRLQKNPCRCSFRRSVRYSLKPKEEAKDVVEPVLQVKENNDKRPENAPNQHCVQLTAQIVEKIADFLSNQIINDVISEYIASRNITNRSQCCDVLSTSVISTSVENLTKGDDRLCPCSGQDCEKEIEFVVDSGLNQFKEVAFRTKASHQITGGYMNPTFVGSNGSIDQLTEMNTKNDDKHIDSCPNKLSNSCKTTENFNSRENVRSKGVTQDYNANEKDTISKKNMLNNADRPRENGTEQKHRQDCHHSSTPHQKKPVLLFLHGAGNSSQVWNNLTAAMVAAGYECIAPDLLGHGMSSAPNRSSCYVFHSLLEDMLKVFDKFVPKNRSAVILGHGYGCSFATAISRYRPEQVVQLVLISSGGPSPLVPPDAAKTSPWMLSFLEPLIMCGFKRDATYSMYGKQLVGCSAEEGAIPPAVFRYVAKGHFWPEGDAAFHKRITTPTLLVHGLRDPHVTLVQQCEMERTIPRSFLEVIPEAGHWAMLEAPEALSHMILCFIDWWAE